MPFRHALCATVGSNPAVIGRSCSGTVEDGTYPNAVLLEPLTTLTALKLEVLILMAHARLSRQI